MQFGENPKGKQLEKIQNSPNYSIDDEKFINRKEINFLGFYQFLFQELFYIKNLFELNMIVFELMILH